jgi:hypothetical protein
VKYTVVYERTPHNYSAYVPDLPGCVAAGCGLVVRSLVGADTLHVTRDIGITTEMDLGARGSFRLRDEPRPSIRQRSPCRAKVSQPLFHPACCAPPASRDQQVPATLRFRRSSIIPSCGGFHFAHRDVAHRVPSWSSSPSCRQKCYLEKLSIQKLVRPPRPTHEPHQRATRQPDPL